MKGIILAGGSGTRQGTTETSLGTNCFQKVVSLIKIPIKPNRIFGLDLVRAFAIISVVYGHGNSILSSLIPAEILMIPKFDGVSIFFVISGFLSGRSLINLFEKEGPSVVSMGNFWIRRWFRTLPTYFLILFLIFAAFYIGGTTVDIRKYLIVLQNFSYPHPNFFMEAWSLGVQEWFYILFPITVICATQLGFSKKKSFLGSAISFIMVPIFVKYFRMQNLMADPDFILPHPDWLNYWDLNFRKQFITRADSVAIGVLGGFVSIYYGNFFKRYSKILLIYGLSLTLLVKCLNYYFVNNLLFQCILSFILTSVGALFLLPFLSEYRVKSYTLFHRVVIKISLISYSLYLLNLSFVQYQIIPKILRMIPPGHLTMTQTVLLKYGLYWILCFFGATLLYKFFEKPTTDLRKKFKLEIKKASAVPARQI